MADDFHRPTRFSNDWFERVEGDVDPVLRLQLAADTAQALLSRVRAGADPEVVERILTLAREDGIDTVAELWSHARPHSLPGALWRVNLLHVLVTQRAAEAAVLYQQGADALQTAAPVVAGVPAPASPDELRSLSETILRGVFTGDFALALDRAAAFAVVTAAGAVESAHIDEPTNPERARERTRLAAALTDVADDLRVCARLWRDESLA
ncbi:DNA-directed RNA polymerase subunit beta [Agrococcus sp. Marseille-Q4369]|uniref:DNA-directed RNA polymerase subunit beta n=1 Tax=Agrococcus sp. Marseille-Q4369 TaxID=2810513 RepID=UPI001B8CBA13|nr:DNA-directed RNA polymerase subunit beta [Agrococcus sp. Marseille-Q4369]QUW19900.1 DNA-directed RNA polymerase subunit beta [Agrococcus sp. Marseille-Q4369]